jgi:hypothetical protein
MNLCNAQCFRKSVFQKFEFKSRHKKSFGSLFRLKTGWVNISEYAENAAECHGEVNRLQLVTSPPTHTIEILGLHRRRMLKEGKFFTAGLQPILCSKVSKLVISRLFTRFFSPKMFAEPEPTFWF